MSNKDTTITITIPGEWNDELMSSLLILDPSIHGKAPHKVMATALAAWHQAQQPPHVLEVGDVVLEWASNNRAIHGDVVTAIGEYLALTVNDTCERPINRTSLDGARVRTKDGREVIAHWPSA